ncbi:MAG: serine/threonine protein kinase [Prevotella sp.]|nr:serine/threonine protein kinase [Prevotella sp.]
MAIIKIQTEAEKRKGIFYQFDSEEPPIGEGGMGKVCRGLCVSEVNGSSRPVAIKFMYDDLPPNAYERARREAEIQLRNDNLVEMLGFIETQDVGFTGEIHKHYHVVSELLNGVSLADILDGKCKDRNGEDVPYAVKMLQDYQNDPEHFAQIVVINVLSGLMALHDAGYIHRDIDPSNIMLTDDGHIKLIDFGIAKQMNTLTTSDKSLTVAGKFMGKPEYAAPELALGDISHQNQTTDIYAVGILLYQCIIGHTPFEGARHEILEMQLKAKLPLGKIKNKALRNIIATACEKKQELRYQTSAQMRVALETMNGARQAMTSKKKFSIIAAALAVIILLSGITMVVKIKQDDAKEEAEAAHVEQRLQEEQSALDAKLQSATSLYEQGISKEDDNYDQQLMDAYKAYEEVEKMATSSNNMKGDSIASKAKKQRTAILSALDSIKAEMNDQVSVLSEVGEEALAKYYKARIERINNFQNNITKKQ